MRKTFPSRKKPKRRDPTRAALFLIAAAVGAGTVLSALFRTRPETFEAVPAAEVFREKASPENPETPLPPRPAPKAPTENVPKKTPPAVPAAVPKKTPTPVPAAKIPAPAPKTPKPAPQKTKAKSKPAPANPYANVPALFGYGADMPPATRAFDASVELLAQRRDFSAFAAALGEKIKDAAASASLIRKGNLNAATFRRLSNLKRATEICRVIDMAGTENLERFFRLPPAAAGTQADRIRADFLQWFFSSRKNGSSPVQKFLYAFYENGGDPRNADHAVRKLFELWTGTPEDDREPYANLMLAFALAHPSVEHARSRVRKPDGAILSPREVYDYFRDADRRGRLIGDVRRMSVSELLFITDARLPLSEFLWVEKKLRKRLGDRHLRQENWASATYSAVPYRMDKATQGVDPYDAYTFEEILERGGVCADQAYFAATTAKCAGIPAVALGGDGPRGGHAWVVSLVGKNAWRQSGSYGYDTGTFRNVCSGNAQHESVLLSRGKEMRGGKFSHVLACVIFADALEQLGEDRNALAVATYSTRAFPKLKFTWEQRLRILRNGRNVAADETLWRSLGRDVLRLGRRDPELAAFSLQIDRKYRFPTSNPAWETAMKRKELRVFKHTLDGTRGDLLLRVLEIQAADYKAKNDLRGLAIFYRRLMKENADRGDVFQAIFRQYQSFISGESDAVLMRAAKDAEAVFNKKIRTKTEEHFRLAKETSIQHVIADAYRNAGAEKKAERLRRKADKRLQKSAERYED